MEPNATHRVVLAIGKGNIVHARSSEGTKNTIDDSDNEIRIQPWYLMFIIKSPGRYPFCREYCIIFEKMSIFYSIGYRSLGHRSAVPYNSTTKPVFMRVCTDLEEEKGPQIMIQ